MALTKVNIGTNEDGTPRYHFASDQPLMVVGPWIKGAVTTKDGTVYDVTDDVIEVAPKHIHEVNHLVGMRYETEGHPLHAPSAADPDPHPFLHSCTDDACGKHADDAHRTHPVERLRAMGREV